MREIGVIPFYIDMEDGESISKAAEFIVSQTDKIDTVINVAGCVVAGAIEMLPVKNIRKQFEVNTFSHLDFTQKLLPTLKDGKIINISSMASYGLFPFISPYCASKRALDILFNSFMMENKRGIKVVSVKPGVIATPLWSKSIKENSQTIENSKDYKNESNYLKQNALENEVKGLSVNKVVQIVSKIDKMSNPKPSYCVGFDSKLVSVVSKLPQCLLNKIIKFKVNKLR